MFTLDEVEITGSYDPRGYVADDNDKGDYYYTLRDDSFDNGSSSHRDSSHTSVEEIILEQEDTSNNKDRLPGKDDPQELHQSISSISPQISDPAILEHDTEAAETIEDPSFPVSDSTDGITRSFKEHIQQLNQTVFSNTTAGESIDEKIVLKQGVLLKMDVEAFIKVFLVPLLDLLGVSHPQQQNAHQGPHRFVHTRLLDPPHAHSLCVCCPLPLLSQARSCSLTTPSRACLRCTNTT